MIAKNFPGRKNARRISALGRLESDTDTAVDGSALRPRSERDIEANKLALRIMPQARAEAIRTKKDRTGRTKYRTA